MTILIALGFAGNMFWYEQRFFYENGQPVDGCNPEKIVRRVKRVKSVKAVVVQSKEKAGESNGSR